MTAAHLLVVGAMKSGTTTLHHDLGQHPGVALAEKEFGGLARFDVGTVEGRARYVAQWDDASPAQLRVDVSANYAMMPHVPGVPERAHVAVPDASILYIVRNPVDRIISHHFHDYTQGVVGPDIDKVVREDRRFLDYSRYATQMHAWLALFPAQRVKVVRFESYVGNRSREFADIVRWLGLPEGELYGELSAVLNAAGTPRARGWLRRFASSPFYRDHLRDRLPKNARSRLAGVVLPQAPPRPPRPAPSTVDWLLEQLEGDLTALHELTNGAVSWDLERSNRPIDPGAEER